MAAKKKEEQTGYQSKWQSQLDDVTDRILNREKFSYDLNGDAFYQQYKDKFVQQGKMAMMDTMGQAAALTGGYGSSYAQNVGQQAYQGYLQGLNDVVPELYQLALDSYNREGDNLMNQYSMLADQDAQEYGRYQDQLAQQQWQQQFDYQKARDAAADAQWLKEFEESKRQYEQSLVETQMEDEENSLSVDMSSVNALGYGPIDEYRLDQLIASGDVEEYIEDGKIKFRKVKKQPSSALYDSTNMPLAKYMMN